MDKICGRRASISCRRASFCGEPAGHCVLLQSELCLYPEPQIYRVHGACSLLRRGASSGREYEHGDRPGGRDADPAQRLRKARAAGFFYDGGSLRLRRLRLCQVCGCLLCHGSFHESLPKADFAYDLCLPCRLDLQQPV